MLPTWFIKKIEKQKKDNFIQEQLQIEVPLIPIKPKEKIEKDDYERGIIEIDCF